MCTLCNWNTTENDAKPYNVSIFSNKLQSHTSKVPLKWVAMKKCQHLAHLVIINVEWHYPSVNE